MQIGDFCDARVGRPGSGCDGLDDGIPIEGRAWLPRQLHLGTFRTMLVANPASRNATVYGFGAPRRSDKTLVVTDSEFHAFHRR